MTEAPNEYIQTIKDASVIYLVDDMDLLQVFTKEDKIVIELFDGDFELCMNKTPNKLNDDFRSFSTLNVSNGHIRITAGKI